MNILLRVLVLCFTLMAAGCPTGGPVADVADGTVQPNDACVGDDCGCRVTGCEKGVCHPELNTCVACRTDQDCGTAYCHPTAFACVQCLRDTHCGDGLCTDDYFCVQCTQDAHCSTGRCDVEKRICLGDCVLAKDCDDGLPCTKEACEGGICSHTRLPDGSACEDGDKCTTNDSCLEGICTAGKLHDDCCTPVQCSAFTFPKDLDGDNCPETCVCKDGSLPGPNNDCICPKVPDCPPGAFAKDLDGDGCGETCVCKSGTEVKPLPEGKCPCELVLKCPEGSEAKDTDEDGCEDTCVCVSPDCLTCTVDTDCDDGNPCTKAPCQQGVCGATLVSPNCCNTACDCYDINKTAPPCVSPGDAVQDEGYWVCEKNTCVAECGQIPKEIKACTCEDIKCDKGLEGKDTDGDTCTDLCVCPGGGLPNDAGSCPSCTNTCDCYTSGMGFPEGCDTEPYWLCEAKTCVPQCGVIPPDAKLCLPCEDLFCFSGQIGLDTDADGCPDTCACPDGTPVQGPAICPCVEASACSIFSKPVDADDDGCVDWCTCESGAVIQPNTPCPCLKEITCPVNFVGLDSDLDGCADTCVCDGVDCLECSSDDECDDQDECTKDGCVQGVCMHKNGCCEPLDCPIGAVQKDTDGDGCFDLCECADGLKPGAETCNCPVSLFCAVGYELVDTTGNGCPDDCLMPCDDACACYEGNSKLTCEAASAVFGASWTCNQGYCEESCGSLAKPHYVCLGCADVTLTCADSLVATDTTDDGCPDTCLCKDGTPPLQGGQCGCTPIFCPMGHKPVDTDGDLCDDACVASCADVCDCTAVSAPPEGSCAADVCEGCTMQWTCVNGGCESMCMNDKSWMLCTEIACQDVSDCPPKKYHCKKADGQCKSVGICVPKTGDCKEEGPAVCGCDAKPYKSACVAHQMGVNVGKKGGCK